jgi:hypothetical protein
VLSAHYSLQISVKMCFLCLALGLIKTYNSSTYYILVNGRYGIVFFLTHEGPRRTQRAAVIFSSVGTNYRKGPEGKVKVQHSPG